MIRLKRLVSGMMLMAWPSAFLCTRTRGIRLSELSLVSRPGTRGSDSRQTRNCRRSSVGCLHFAPLLRQQARSEQVGRTTAGESLETPSLQQPVSLSLSLSLTHTHRYTGTWKINFYRSTVFTTAAFSPYCTLGNGY